MKHGFMVHEQHTPSCGVISKTECGETFMFVRAKEGKPEDMDCPTCVKEYGELRDGLSIQGIALPGCTFYIVEDSDVVRNPPKLTRSALVS